MRKKLALIFVFSLSCMYSHAGIARVAAGSPVEHMTFLSDQEETLSLKYLSYMSEVAHGGRARKMEKRRQELLAGVRTAIREGGKLKPFEGDASLRNAYVTYWNVLLSVLNEDYHKIIDMEEVAERSYDAMEAYLLMQEKADEKLTEAYLNVPVAFQAFADKHNVRLTEGQSSKLTRKVNQTASVNNYLHKLFLIYFKSTVQESNMIEALNKKDINGMEQNKNALKNYAEEGLLKLDTLKPFKGDGSVITACRKVLEFQKAESTKVNALSDFMLKSDEFEKMKKAFDAKPANSRTQADVDSYNKNIAAFNKAMQDYNKVNDELNNGRNKVITNWETSRKRFMDLHVPHK